jgi:4-hydroxy-tetrahydrodipicolinate synthase
MFRGSIVALVTPMGAAGELDLAALDRLIEFHIGEGTDGFVIAGTTGESPTLAADELEALVGRAVAAVAGRVPVIAGSGTNSTAKTIELTRRVARAGADAALVVTPYYNKPMQAGLLAHYRAVADASEVPVVLYNVPGRTACDLKPETAAALAEHERIVGLKEALADPARWQALKELCPDDFCLLSGDDATAMDFVLAGGEGVISVTANVAPRLMHGLCAAALAGERRKAMSINDRLNDLHGALFVESSPIPVKWAVARMGLIDPGIRLPLTWLAAADEAVLLAAMRTAGVTPA